MHWIDVIPNPLYDLSDKIYRHKEAIEAHLVGKERDLFALDEQVILYDLTNTFFEGRALGNPKAKFGVSKEKRSDCRLLTLGLVIDGNGFAKSSRIFAGNQSEPKTLLQMVAALTRTKAVGDNGQIGQLKLPLAKQTIVIDAGIATEDNLKELKEHGYHYICVSRSRPEQEQAGDEIVIKDEPGHAIKVKRLIEDNEVYLYCQSEAKQNMNPENL